MRMLDISYLNISGTDCKFNSLIMSLNRNREFFNTFFNIWFAKNFLLNVLFFSVTPSRDHVFHVTCPKEATTKNIVSLFQPFGQVQVWWQDDNNLFVSLNDKDQAALVMKNIEIEKGSHIRVVPFTQYQSSRGGKRPLGVDVATSSGGGGKHHKKKGGGKKGKGKGGGGNRQHNSCSTSSSSSGGVGGGDGGDGGDTPPGASDGGDEGSPTFSGSDSVHHQKKKRPKTENGGGACGGKKGGGGKGGGGPRFEEPSNWD